MRPHSAAPIFGCRNQGPQVAEWEWELNALVYELYGLTEEEIALVRKERRYRSD